MGVRYVCSRDEFNIVLGCPCCLFHGSLYLLMAVTIVLEEGNEKI
jgi:hypothetical protein